MKKLIIAAVLYIACMTWGVAEILCQAPSDDTADEISIIISIEYNLSTLNFSTRSEEAQSILIWRDMFLHGGKFMGEIGFSGYFFNRVFFEVEMARATDGHWIDDDTNNTLLVSAVTESAVTLLSLDLALGKESDILTTKIGFNISWLGFQNYNYRSFSQYPFFVNNIDGPICGYDQYMYRLYIGVTARLVDTSFFYADLGGQAGLGLGIGSANWFLRSDLKHPESFRSTGLFLRAGGMAEIGFRLGMFTLFSNIQMNYEICPWLSNLQTFYQNGNVHKQGLYQELSRASWSIGVKAVF